MVDFCRSGHIYCTAENIGILVNVEDFVELLKLLRLQPHEENSFMVHWPGSLWLLY